MRCRGTVCSNAARLMLQRLLRPHPVTRRAGGFQGARRQRLLRRAPGRPLARTDVPWPNPLRPRLFLPPRLTKVRRLCRVHRRRPLRRALRRCSSAAHQNTSRRPELHGSVSRHALSRGFLTLIPSVAIRPRRWGRALPLLNLQLLRPRSQHRDLVRRRPLGRALALHRRIACLGQRATSCRLTSQCRTRGRQCGRRSTTRASTWGTRASPTNNATSRAQRFGARRSTYTQQPIPPQQLPSSVLVGRAVPRGALCRHSRGTSSTTLSSALPPARGFT